MDDENVVFDDGLDPSADAVGESILSSLINDKGELEDDEPGVGEEAERVGVGDHSQHSREADDLLEAALEYHELGLPITLCQPEKKKPLVKDWPKYEWTPDEIRRAFDKVGALNVGVVLGPRSGIIDIECDGPHGDEELLELFDGDVPVTPTWYSARGAHRLFRWQEELRLCGKSAVRVGDLEFRLGVDGRGAQSLLPPSITDSWGRKWAISLDDCDVAPLPANVLAKLLAHFGRQVLARQSEEEMRHSMIHSKRHSNAVYHTVSHLPEKPASAVSHLPQSSVSADLSLPKTPVQVMPPSEQPTPPLPLKIRQAIECSLPGAPGYRNRLLLQFARYLKAIPDLANCQAEELEPYVRLWYERALPNIGTADFGETWSDFAIAWDRVQFPVGQGPLDETYRAGLEQMPESASRYRHRKMRDLVALCQELQRRSDPHPFWLACRPTASVLGISPPTANRWLNRLLFDGVLERVTEGSRGRAAEYYYRGGSGG